MHVFFNSFKAFFFVLLVFGCLLVFTDVSFLYINAIKMDNYAAILIYCTRFDAMYLFSVCMFMSFDDIFRGKHKF